MTDIAARKLRELRIEWLTRRPRGYTMRDFSNELISREGLPRVAIFGDGFAIDIYDVIRDQATREHNALVDREGNRLYIHTVEPASAPIWIHRSKASADQIEHFANYLDRCGLAYAKQAGFMHNLARRRRREERRQAAARGAL